MSQPVTYISRSSDPAPPDLDRQSTFDRKASSEPDVEAPTGDNTSSITEEAGVTRIEYLFTVFCSNGKGLWTLYFSIALVSYAYGLAGDLVYNFLSFATSSFEQHAVLGTISVVTSIIAGVGQPFIAKLANSSSRPMTYLFSLVCYVVGLIVVATAKSAYGVAGGEVIYQIGATGLDFMNSLIVADLTPLQWRGLMTSLLSVPYIINAYISGYIVQDLGTAGWRWGFGMFAIIMPIVVAPALCVLFYADIQAQKMAIGKHSAEATAKRAGRSWFELTRELLSEMDGFGLLLLGTSWTLLLLPFTLAAGANNGYKNTSLIAMFVVGGVVLFAFAAYEMYYAEHPVVPKRILNRTFMGCVIVDVLYELSGLMQLTYWSSWVYVVTDWSLFHWTQYNNTLTVALCLFGVLAGVLMRYFHNYKWVLVAGISVRIIGGGLHVLSTSNHKNVVLAFIPVLSGLGGGLSVVSSQVAVQAAVPHVDMAQSMAALALWSRLGQAIGSAIASAIWTGHMPGNLAKHLSPLGLNQTEILEIYGSITVARDSEPATRTGVIAAYNETVRPMYIAALVLSIVPLAATFLLDNYYLGKSQNAIDGKLHPLYGQDGEDTAAEGQEAEIR